MKKITILFLVMVSILTCKNAISQTTQTTLIFRPDGCYGQDAHVDSIGGLPSAQVTNFGSLDEIVPLTWTFNAVGGTTGVGRAYINFTDLKLITQNTNVVHAYLSLYGKSSSSTSPQGNSGDNKCWVKRVTSAWDQNTVTWNNQPTSTPTNRVALPASTSQWNYNVTLDVTQLVQDMINQPKTNRYGFQIRLQTEDIYRSIVFATSDNSNPALRPKLEVQLNYCDSTSDSLQRRANNNFIYKPDVITKSKQANNLQLNVTPNPVRSNLLVSYNASANKQAVIDILSSDSHLLQSISINSIKGNNKKEIQLNSNVTRYNKLLIVRLRIDDATSSANVLVAQ